MLYEKPRSVVSCEYVWRRTDRYIDFPWSVPTLPDPRALEGELPRPAAGSGDRPTAESPATRRASPELALGQGSATLDLLRAGYDAYGVDISAERIASGREQLDRAGFPSADRLTVHEQGQAALPERSFDAVCSQDVLEHIADLDQAVAEIARLMAPARSACTRSPPAGWCGRPTRSCPSSTGSRAAARAGG